MDDSRQRILTSYISYLYITDRSYGIISKRIKYVADFLKSTREVNRRDYLNCKRKDTDVMTHYPLMCSAICDLLSYLEIGYGRRGKAVKPSKKLDSISKKNRKMLNDFTVWLTDNNDYSPRAVDLYHTSMKKHFEYANEANIDNCRRFIKMPEEEKLAPVTIWLRITAIEKFSKWMKKPLELERPKMKRKLDTNNVPTEDEYNHSLEYLKTKSNKDYYFLIRVSDTAGTRLPEFLQSTWEGIVSGEMALRGKGSKYRHFFFQERLQQEAKAYAKECGRTGLFVVGKFGPMTQRGLSQGMKAWGNCYGTSEERMHPHTFRRFFTKMSLKKNKDVIQLADLLGHGSVDTTRIYLQKSHDEQKRDFNKDVT